MRLTGPLTVAAGLLLGAVSISQAFYLSRLIAGVRDRCVRAEMRGLTGALRWRLERDLALLDHNTPSTERALAEMLEDSGAVTGWAALFAADGSVLASTLKIPPLPPARVKSVVEAPRELLPAVEAGAGGALVGLNRLTVGERQLVLAVGFPGNYEQLNAPVWTFVAGSLSAGLFGSLLLVGHGTAMAAAVRRQRLARGGSE